MDRSISARSERELKLSRRRGQSSLEFLAMMVMALLVFTGFYSFFTERQVRAMENERRIVARSVADKISFSLDLALVEGEGFNREIDLREDIGGRSYNVTLGKGVVLLEYSDKTITSDTAVKNVTGEVKPGKNIVENIGGTINVSQT